MAQKTEWSRKRRQLFILVFVCLILVWLLQYKQPNLGVDSNSPSAPTRTHDIKKSECSLQGKPKIDIASNIHKHGDKLALIVGSPTFTDLLGTFCHSILNMEVIRKTLAMTSSFWVMDPDQFETHPDYEWNEIHAPFWTNKEYGFKYDVHSYDYVYFFLNADDLNLKDTFKLIDYSSQINVTCFVLVTNLIVFNGDGDANQNALTQIESYLNHSTMNYVIFEVKGVYLANDPLMSRNHDVALLFDRIFKHNAENLDKLAMIFQDDRLDILLFEDIMKYIAITPIYKHLYGKRFYLKPSQNSFTFSELANKITDVLNLRQTARSMQSKQNAAFSRNVHESQWAEFECYFGVNALTETSIDRILNTIYMDLQKHKNIISRKSDSPPFDKSAVFCDTRFDEEMVFIVLNVMIHLDQSWQIELFVSNESKKQWQSNEYLRPYIETSKIVLKDLAKYYETSPVEYYQSIEFWTDINHEKVLTFHADSVLCGYSKYKVEDFLEYDYVGAPWRYHIGRPEFDGRTGNGGLSLRSKSFMIKLLTQYPQQEQRKSFRKLPEDFFLSRHIGLLSGVHLPRYGIAKRFAMEADYYGFKGHEIAAGVHRHYVKYKKQLQSLMTLCAEFEIAKSRVSVIEKN